MAPGVVTTCQECEVCWVHAGPLVAGVVHDHFLGTSSGRWRDRTVPQRVRDPVSERLLAFPCVDAAVAVVIECTLPDPTALIASLDVAQEAGEETEQRLHACLIGNGELEFELLTRVARPIPEPGRQLPGVIADLTPALLRTSGGGRGGRQATDGCDRHWRPRKTAERSQRECPTRHQPRPNVSAGLQRRSTPNRLTAANCARKRRSATNTEKRLGPLASRATRRDGSTAPAAGVTVSKSETPLRQAAVANASQLSTPHRWLDPRRPQRTHRRVGADLDPHHTAHSDSLRRVCRLELERPPENG